MLVGKNAPTSHMNSPIHIHMHTNTNVRKSSYGLDGRRGGMGWRGRWYAIAGALSCPCVVGFRGASPRRLVLARTSILKFLARVKRAANDQ